MDDIERNSKTRRIGIVTPTLVVLIAVTVITISVASPNEPLIYVTFNRWENRTFSPRIYFLLLQKYGLRNQLLDLNNEYYQYLTDKGLSSPAAPQNSSKSSIIFKKLVNARKPSTNPIYPVQQPTSRDRSTLRIEGLRTNYLNLRSKDQFQRQNLFGKNDTLAKVLLNPKDEIFQPLPVLFPSAVPENETVSTTFPGRIAYPGSSNRRGVSQNIKRKINTENLTADDAVDTTRLTIDIIKQNQWDNENIILSPFSILNLLSLLFLGSNGTTYNELGDRVKPDHPFQITEDQSREFRFHAAFERLIELLNRGSNQNVAIDICSRLIFDERYPLLDEFRANAYDYYHARSSVYDFEKQGNQIVREINSWISLKTKNRITSVLDVPPSPTTTMMLVNAVYFRGDWEIPFIKELTQRKPFYVSPTETVDVHMMTNILNVPYLQTESYSVIGIPYKGMKVCLFVMLPKNPGVMGLAEMESQLTYDKLDNFTSLKESQVTIQLPKMRLESNGGIVGMLKKFGLSSMFDPNEAEFGRMSETRGLYVTSVIHKAIFEIDELGVTAAAVSVATVDRTLDVLPILFVVNRPFAFVIMNMEANTILFYGRVTRPLPFGNE